MYRVLRAIINGRKLVPISSSKAQKRWHLAYNIVYCTRALLSLCLHKANPNQKFFSRTPSCVVVDVEPDYFPSINESSNVVIDVDFPSIDQSSLSKLIRKRNTTQLAQFGGVEGVVAKLKTNAENGIKGDVDGIASRRNIFGSNSYRKPPAKTLQVVMDAIAEAFKDPLILILLVCAALSLGFGVHKDGLKGCSDGTSTFIAVFLVIAVSASINFWLKKQFNKLSQGSSDIWVDVTRNGQQQQIPIFDVVVGDVVSLKIGDQVPADGLFLDGHSLKVDESSITAKSYPLEEVDQIFNPFLLSGTKVIDGDARMLVTSVGTNTEWGQTMSKINYDFDEKTPLQAKLKNLALFIGMVGMLFAFLVLVILFIRYFTGNMYGDNGSREFTGDKKNIHDLFKAVVGILATPVATAATAFPESFLLAVKVTFAYSIKRMLANQALVRNLSASEAMGSVTAICTDKRGTLTMNQMKVTMFWVGPKYIGESASSSIYPSVRELLCQGVGLHKTQYPSGSLSELANKAIQDWGVESMCMNIEELRKSCDIIHEAFNFKKTQSVLIRKKADQTIHLHHKGSPEVILAMCSHYYDASGNILVISNQARENLWQVIQRMVTTGCQCIAFAHKQLSQENYFDENYTRMLEEDCSILLGLVGLKDPCRPSARQAVIDCQSLGVNIKMITADDLSTAEAIAIECGIIDLNQGIATGEVVDGEEFRNWTDDERMEKVNRIRVIARASHLHKLLMVQFLKHKGHAVAVTGDSTKDARAFREARAGISMGIRSADMAKVSLDAVILNNDFDSVVKVLRCGRGIYINFQAFTQFQLTVSIVSLVFEFVTAISASEPTTINIVAAISTGKISYASLQLLWVKLAMGTLAALATTIEQPTTSVMQKPLINRTEPFITNIMWRDILIQALYQITILLTIQFQGESVFSVNAKVKDTMAFNTQVLFQIFTIFNARKFERNIVEGIQRKKLFWGIIGIIIVLQVAMVELLNKFDHLERLSWGQWGTCIGIAAVTWFIGWLSSTYQFLKHLWGAMVQMVDSLAFLHAVLLLAFLYGMLQIIGCWLSSTYQFLKHLWGAMVQMVHSLAFLHQVLLLAFLYGMLIVSFYWGLRHGMLFFLCAVLVHFCVREFQFCLTRNVVSTIVIDFSLAICYWAICYFLVRRRYILGNRCRMRCTASKSVDHLASLLWAIIFCIFGVQWVQQKGVLGALWSWARGRTGKRHQKARALAPLCLMWPIWLEKNRRIFQEVVRSVYWLESRFLRVFVRLGV